MRQKSLTRDGKAGENIRQKTHLSRTWIKWREIFSDEYSEEKREIDRGKKTGSLVHLYMAGENFVFVLYHLGFMVDCVFMIYMLTVTTVRIGQAVGPELTANID